VPIDYPSDNIFIGSENALGMFKGEIFDLVFSCRPLAFKEMQLIYKELQLPLEERRQAS